MVLEETELKILKALYEDGYNYIARDENKNLKAYQDKPYKLLNVYYWQTSSYAPEDLGYVKVLFPHIKWEDKEPTSIERLLNE